MQRTIPDLYSLFSKAIAATRCRTAPVTPSEPVRPPTGVIRSAYADVVSQIFHAEQATGRMCRLMAGRTGTALADIPLQFQAGDEANHAELHESYLSRIGDIRPIDPPLPRRSTQCARPISGLKRSLPPITSCLKARR